MPQQRLGPIQQISIHALREEGDRKYMTHAELSRYISIHALREEGDRPLHRGGHGLPAISIHALREEGDPRRPARSPSSCNFYPRPPRGGRPPSDRTGMMVERFLSTPSARRATNIETSFYQGTQISIHALREEGDLGSPVILFLESEFLSTPSARRATWIPVPTKLSQLEFLSTPSARRATLLRAECYPHCHISIHALREEGDGSASSRLTAASDFYPRPPRGGRPTTAAWHSLIVNFYPRPPRGGRPAALAAVAGFSNFYPRPPRGGRRRDGVIRARRKLFLSTPSARRATPPSLLLSASRIFLSTPSARRATADPRRRWTGLLYFYPRPPRGGRLAAAIVEPALVPFLSTPSARRATNDASPTWEDITQFLSTPSARRATRSCRARWRWVPISIHALREEGDEIVHALRPVDLDFYPRPPRGGRPSERRAARAPLQISIHALREEGDGVSHVRGADQINFYPRPPRGGRRYTLRMQVVKGHFYPRPPRGGRPAARSGLPRVLYFYPRPPRGGRHCLPVFFG